MCYIKFVKIKHLNLFLFISLIFGLVILGTSCKTVSKNTKNSKKNISSIKKLKISCSNNMCNIPAGEFIMGCNKEINKECKLSEEPASKVYLDAFKVDQYEVTVAKEYCTYVNKHLPTEGEWEKAAKGCILLMSF